MDVPVLLLEFEGVLVDTRAARAAALTEALAAEGVAPDQSGLALVHGLTVEESFRRLAFQSGRQEDQTAVEIGRMRAEREFAARIGKGLTLQKGAVATVERLSSKARCAIVTRASRREVEFVLNLAGLYGTIRPVIALEDVSPPKPAPEPYLAALKRIGQLIPDKKLRPIAVEDSIAGLRSAKAVGIPCVLVGDFPADDAWGADAWIESIEELTIERINALIESNSRRD